MPAPPTYPVPTLAVRAWSDPVIDAVGHDVRSAYVERFWLGLLGPSATWLLRRLVQGLEDRPDGFDLDLALTATQLGLGGRSGRHSPFFRSIERCCRFGAAQPDRRATLRVRRQLPPLTRMQIARLPLPLQEAHQAWVDGPSHGAPRRPAPGAGARPGPVAPRAGRGPRGHRTPAPHLAAPPGHRPRGGGVGRRPPPGHAAWCRRATCPRRRPNRPPRGRVRGWRR